jgi:SAM-dependent methyltransferase
MALYDYFPTARRTHLGAWVAMGATRHFARLVDLRAPAARDVIEIGPGTGWLARHLMQRGCRYVCYEPNAVMAEPLRALGATVHAEEAPPLAEADGSCDLFVASHVLEHMAGVREAFALVHEASRVLRPGGIAAIVSPDYPHWGDDFFECDYTHAYPVTINRLRQMMQDCGLRVETTLLRYGNMPTVPGALVDSVVRVVSGLARVCLPGSALLTKASLTFHANAIAVGRKP